MNFYEGHAIFGAHAKRMLDSANALTVEFNMFALVGYRCLTANPGSEKHEGIWRVIGNQ